ncbi:hypothetical protein FRC15_001047 [Serendipita sp. 397]|nr:hypothetical protein FRC15_001047 [Serendipita sp. 397]
MMSLWSLLTASVLYAGLAAAVPLWGQCGGQGWSGSTVCDAGSYCYPFNPFYSQCIPTPSSSTSSAAASSSSVSRTLTTTTSTRVTSTVTGSTRTSTSSSSTPTSSGVQIRAVADPVYHYYVQSLGGVAVLGPQSSGGYFTINGTIKLNSSPPVYLNIASTTNTYKALTFDSTATFSGWALEGDTLVTATGSAYGRQLNFLACPSSTTNYYVLYLQTGSQTPSSSCTRIDLHLPCLGC